jgi:nitrogen regulatory protein PII
MKKLQIILDPSDLDSVTDILNESAVRHFTAAELKEFGVGTQEGVFRGRAYNIRFKARITVEAILPAETVPQVVAALRKVVPPARQLEVYVSPVESLDMAAPAKSPVLAGTGVN